MSLSPTHLYLPDLFQHCGLLRVQKRLAYVERHGDGRADSTSYSTAHEMHLRAILTLWIQ